MIWLEVLDDKGSDWNSGCNDHKLIIGRDLKGKINVPVLAHELAHIRLGHCAKSKKHEMLKEAEATKYALAHLPLEKDKKLGITLLADGLRDHAIGVNYRLHPNTYRLLNIARKGAERL